MKKQQGFTLVEIAIVMVIIGLLLGGVLKGQEIIKNAKIKNLETDVRGVAAAVYTYQDRYHALPGDDNGVARFGLSEEGDGNSNIAGKFDSNNDGDESRLVWLHLRNAGLVAGALSDQNQPINAFSGKTGVESGITPIAGVVNGIPGVVVGFAGIPGDVALILDSHTDDGLAISGDIQSATAGAVCNGNANAACDVYFEM